MVKRIKGKMKEETPSIVVISKEAVEAVAQYRQEYLNRIPRYKHECLK